MPHFLLLLLFALSSPAFAKTVKYELVIENKPMNMSGVKTVDFSLTVNGGIPGPVLEFTEGDDAEITVINRVPGEEVSTHWHGILLPPEMDGVAYVNTPPIHSGESFTFRFKIRQHGTYWYHSHTGVQEQKGVYGALVIHPRKPTTSADVDATVVLSDWTDENAVDVLKNLRKDGDYYLYKKRSMRSIFGALRAGGLGTYFGNEWIRMGGMDLSDVGYDAFLINGKRDSQLVNAKPGQRVRLRIINAAASSYFYVSLGGTPMQVISADGVDIRPARAKEILIGMAETYDVLFTVPDTRNYELRATAQDVTGFTSAWIGNAAGERVKVTDKPLPDLYAPMDHGGHGSGHAAHADHSSHDAPSGHEAHGSHAGHAAHTAHAAPATPVIETLTVEEIEAAQPRTIDPKRRVHEVKLVLGGDMERYVWHINGKAIFEDRTIEIQEQDLVRFTFVNETMMHHPMHLHGHFFRVLTEKGALSPLKHTVDMSPHTTRTIEFVADEPGQWMLHCHNLYHMKTGMARVVKYSSFTPTPTMSKHEGHDPHLHDHWYNYGSAELSSNHGHLYLRRSSTWNQFEARMEGANSHGHHFKFGKEWKYEGDLFYRRWFNNYFNVIAGGTSFENTESAIAGVGYILPLLIESHWLINHEGKFRLDLEKRLQWTSHVFSEIEFNWRPDQGGHEWETEISLMYAPSWRWSAGLMLTNYSLGGGVEVQF